MEERRAGPVLQEPDGRRIQELVLAVDIQMPELESYRPLIELARREDLGSGDVSSEITIAQEQTGRGRLVFREPAVACGMEVARQILACYDERLVLDERAADGETVGRDVTVGLVSGPLRQLLAAERVLLNFLGRLSGVATTTAQYVRAVNGLAVEICDTRKTTPGWRMLEKYAVACGGGCNHRMGLYDAVLIKDNHLAALGRGEMVKGLQMAMERLARRPEPVDFVEVEVDDLGQLSGVLAVEGVDMVLLDNMTPDELRRAVAMRDEHSGGRKVLLESSGNVTLQTVRQAAETGVDRISVGALTHSVKSVDIGLDLE